MTVTKRILPVFTLFIATSLAAKAASAQLAPANLPLPPADPTIVKAIATIDPANIKADIAKLVSFGNRSTLSSMDTDLPPGTGINAAADWLFAEYSRISAECGGCLEVKRDDYVEPAKPGTRITRDTRLQNIYAVLKGTDPAQANRRVLVTGHYDSRNSDNFNTHDPAPGANDDASGVAVSLECARILSKLKFPSTIVFAAVAGEEQGLNGSRHLARLAKAEGWDLEEVLNNDIVGGDTTPNQKGQNKYYVRVFSEGVPGPATIEQVRQIQTLGAESDSTSRELARAIQEIDHTYFRLDAMLLHADAKHPLTFGSGTKFTPPFQTALVFRRDRFLRGGDHTSFNAEGFAAVRFTEWQENYDHQHQTPRVENGTQFGDFIQYVDFDYIANVARLNAAALATFATAPGQPREVHVLNKNLDNNTELIWQPPAGAPAGTTYEIVYRLTDEPTWTNRQSAGTALTIILPVSKDNVIFGVRSIDPDGHKSPAVYPTPLSR